MVVLLTAAISRPGAATTELFISEYVEGSSNNKAIEIYNGTGAPVNLATGGYSVQMFFNGSASAGLTINLTGTIADGDVYVLAQASASATILAQADQTSTAGWFNGDDAVVLRKGTTVIDVIGQIGSDPGTEWGSGVASTADNTLRRKNTICLGDVDGSNAFDPATEWDGFATDTFDGLGSHVATCAGPDAAPTVVSTFPANGATSVPASANLSVTFSEPVNFSTSSFTLVCSVSGSKAAAISGGPTTFAVNPAVDFVAGETCTFTILAAGVTDTDTNDPPNAMVANFVVGFTAFDVCAAPTTPTWQIQGSGAASPLAGTTVTTRGVVVGDYEGSSPTLRGFYIQDPTGDGNASTSDGLFVFNGNNNTVNLGDVVVVTGTVSEFQGQTQVSATAVNACGTGTVAPVDVTLPAPSADFLEQYEGMLVRLPQALEVTEHFQLGRFGQVVVSSGARLRQPTDVLAPGAAAAALQAANNLNRLIIDDGLNSQNPDPIVFGRGGQPLSAANTLRAGDTATSTVGVMTYTWAGNSASGNAYRVRPVGALGGFVKFDAVNPRPAAAPAATGSLRVASMNLLNFFNTFSGCTNGVGGATTDCRGADNTTEFQRQLPKTLAAILGTGADVVGVIEVENDGYGPASALQTLVDGLNTATAPGTWAFIDVDGRTGQVNALGTDAIKVGLLYRPARVVPVGLTAALNSVAFVNGGDSVARNRPSLAQAFEQFTTGARFVVSVNHLKSKGSDCDAPDAGDGQGNCNGVRTNAATELTAWLASDPTGTGDPDVLVLGDLNAYSMEDPLSVLASASYTNLVPTFGGGYSYVFDGQWGSLDHALATASLRPQVTGAHDWYINADEPSVLDYNTDFKNAGQVASLYAPDQFRMSDHNPLLVDLDLVSPRDTSAMVNGAGEIVLWTSGGLAAGDAGSEANFGINVKFKPRSTMPEGHVNLVMRRTEVDGVHTYQVKATAITALLRDVATGQALIVARATISDITSPASPVVVDANATMRVTVDDNGNPGIGADTIGLTVLTSTNTLWFSSNGNGPAVNQVIVGGNLHVR